MKNTITIQFASLADHDQAQRQMNRAQEYARKGNQLGALGQALMTSCIARAKTVTTNNRTSKGMK